MNAKYEKTLERIFTDPVHADVRWRDVETMLVSLGAKIEEGRGSRVRVMLNGVAAVFHRPHPKPDTKTGAVKSLREFLTEAGINR